MPASNIEQVIDDAMALSAYPLPRRTLEHLATSLAPLNPNATAETGCGGSTLLFSRFSHTHIVFAFNEFGVFDRVKASRSVGPAKLDFVEGATQQTLPRYDFAEALDAVLIDGPHAYPFPDLEYFHFYPNIRPGGILVIDDIQIRTIHNLFDFLCRDAMFELETVVHQTAFFRRTTAPVYPADADGWHEQGYNRSELLRFTWRERLRRLLRSRR